MVLVICHTLPHSHLCWIIAVNAWQLTPISIVSLGLAFTAALITAVLLTLPKSPWLQPSSDVSYFARRFIFISEDSFWTVAVLCLISILMLVWQTRTWLQLNRLGAAFDQISISLRRPWIVLRGVSPDFVAESDNDIFIAVRCRRRARLLSASLRLVCTNTVQIDDQRGRRNVSTILHRWHLPLVRLRHAFDAPPDTIPHTPEQIVLHTSCNLISAHAAATTPGHAFPQIRWNLEGEIVCQDQNGAILQLPMQCAVHCARI